mmetsp:Transcript_13534/g.54716  ORF Transcript_13534/g.54716 Transcript_13534/m.54716 type:complete len:203 (+) Transcript_13534:1735-2343(+)
MSWRRRRGTSRSGRGRRRSTTAPVATTVKPPESQPGRPGIDPGTARSSTASRETRNGDGGIRAPRTARRGSTAFDVVRRCRTRSDPARETASRSTLASYLRRVSSSTVSLLEISPWRRGLTMRPITSFGVQPRRRTSPTRACRRSSPSSRTSPTASPVRTPPSRFSRGARLDFSPAPPRRRRARGTRRADRACSRRRRRRRR